MSYLEISRVVEEIEPLILGIARRLVYDETESLLTGIVYRSLRFSRLTLGWTRRRTVLLRSSSLRNGHVTITRTPW